jgi:hypothetical protein
MKNSAAIFGLLAASLASTASAQEGAIPQGVPHLRVVGFEGKNGSFEDLNSGNVPSFSFIAPTSATISTAVPTAERSATLTPTTTARSSD